MTYLHYIYPPYLTEKSCSKLPSHLFKIWDRGLRCFPTTLLNLPKSRVICIEIEKGGPNNFAQVITIYGNLYWKQSINKKC